jgi:AraC family transcriptional regulator
VVRRGLADYIEANLAQTITVAMLAQVACLSEYHLTRMFRVSFGMPPSVWVAGRRIERAVRQISSRENVLTPDRQPSVRSFPKETSNSLIKQ